MSYCRFRNTLQDLRDCESDMSVESKEEHIARKRLVELCQDIADSYADDADINGEYQEED